MKKIWKRPATYVFLVSLVLSLWLIISLISMNVLPGKYIALVVIIFAVFLCAAAWLSLHRKRSERIGGLVLSVLILIGSIAGLYYVKTAQSTLKKLQDTSGKETTCVYVMNESDIQSIDQLQGKTVGYLDSIKPQGTQGVLDMLKSKNIDIMARPETSSMTMVTDLKNGTIQAMIMDRGYLSSVADLQGQENLENEVRSIYDYAYDANSKNQATRVTNQNDTFNILISGIDTRSGALDYSSRSDVNLIATVNPKTHVIMLISIPRDYYVPIVDGDGNVGASDKLTHSGLGGIESTEKTLEHLLGIEINYNVKVNFSSLINMVDVVGGIDVNNPQPFTASSSGETFSQGNIHLDGDQALTYVRERYAFANGDRERGMNQMRVLTALIQKVISPSVISNYGEIMNVISSSAQTNMPSEDMMKLVKKQLEDGQSWKIYTYSLDGTTGPNYSPALGENASMMYPDEGTVFNAKADINAVETGVTPIYTNHES